MELSSFWKENGVFSDVVADFKALKSDGLTRRQITAHVLAEYQAALEDADDSIFVLAGLAYAQIQSGGILKGTKEAVLSSCDTMTTYLSDGGRDKEEAVLFLTAIDNLKSYVEKGKPEKKERLFCGWKINDVYALRLHGEEYKSTGLEGKWLLFRTVGYIKLGRDTFPYVYISITHTDMLPQTEAQLAEAVYLPTDFRHQYRGVLTWESKKSFDSFDFIYVGTFENIESPVNEYRFPPEKEDIFSVPLPLSMLEHGICRRYERFINGGLI